MEVQQLKEQLQITGATKTFSGAIGELLKR